MTAYRSNMKSVEIYNRTGDTKGFRSVMEASRMLEMSPHTLRRRLADGCAFTYLGTTWRVRFNGNI